MEAFTSILVAVGFLIVLAVTSLRYGVDSRDGFDRRRQGFASRGIVWDVPATARTMRQAPPHRKPRTVAAPAACESTPCAA